MHCHWALPASVLGKPASVQLQMIPAAPPRQFMQEPANSHAGHAGEDWALTGHSGIEKSSQTQGLPS